MVAPTDQPETKPGLHDGQETPAQVGTPGAAGQSSGAAPAPEGKKSFFATLPGIITAALGGLTALTGLITALNASPWMQPKPTPTTAPVVTTTAASALAAGGLLVDDFSDASSGWEIALNDDYTLGYVDGAYRFKVVTTEYDVWSAPNAQPDLADLSMEVEVQQVAGPSEALYGLMVRVYPNDNFYLFAINGDREYCAQRCEEGEYEVLIRWASSRAIRPAGRVNRLRVDCLGAGMRFFVNDVEVCELIDNKHASGGIGLLASTFEGDPLDVRFDNLQVRPLARLQ